MSSNSQVTKIRVKGVNYDLNGRLYDGTGDNTDGSMSQQAITSELNRIEQQSIPSGISDYLDENDLVHKSINLLNIAPKSSATTHGLTWSVVSTNHLVASGTANTTNTDMDMVPKESITLTAGSYVLSLNGTASYTVAKPVLFLFRNGSWYGNDIRLTNGCFTFTLGSTIEVTKIKIRCSTNAVINIDAFMQLEPGTEKSDYIPPITAHDISTEKIALEALSKSAVKPAFPFSSYHRIGVLGDSYASGSNYASSGWKGYRYDLAWPQIIARRNGIKVSQFSFGGLTTRLWLTNAHGYPKLSSSPAQDLYIISLGINDLVQDGYGVDYIGSIADIDDSDYNNNADTFYGNYGKIIKKIQEYAPCSLQVLTTVRYSSTYDTDIALFNAAIVDIGSHFGIPVIDLFNSKLYKSSFFTSNLISGHPTMALQSAIADAIEDLFSECVKNNAAYFKDYATKGLSTASGTAANRPSASSVNNGATYWDKTNEILWISNGSSWSKIEDEDEEKESSEEPTIKKISPEDTTFVYRKNLFDSEFVWGGLTTAANNLGQEYDSNEIIRSGFIEVKPSTSYVFKSFNTESKSVYFAHHAFLYDENKNCLTRVNAYTSTVVNTTDKTRYIRICSRGAGYVPSGTSQNYIKMTMVEGTTPATEYNSAENIYIDNVVLSNYDEKIEEVREEGISNVVCIDKIAWWMGCRANNGEIYSDQNGTYSNSLGIWCQTGIVYMMAGSSFTFGEKYVVRLLKFRTEHSNSFEKLANTINQQGITSISITESGYYTLSLKKPTGATVDYLYPEDVLYTCKIYTDRYKPVLDVSFLGATGANADNYYGDCTTFKTNTGKTIIIDFSTSTAMGGNLYKALYARGIYRVDYAILSHYHQDHVEGLLRAICGVSGRANFLDFKHCTFFLPDENSITNYLLSKDENDQYIYSAKGISFSAFSHRMLIKYIMSKYSDAETVELQPASTTSTYTVPKFEGEVVFVGVDTHVDTSGEEPQLVVDGYSTNPQLIYNIDDVTIEFWNYNHSVFENDISSNYNDWSLCCDVVYGSKRICMTGDLGPIGESLCWTAVKKSDIMKSQHHGWHNSAMNANFICKVQPDIVVTEDAKSHHDITHSSSVYTNGNPIQDWCESHKVPNYRTFINKTMDFRLTYDSIEAVSKMRNFIRGAVDDGDGIIDCGTDWSLPYGNSSNRPKAKRTGTMFFDTNLGKPIFWNGTNWVDSTGATL